MIWAGNFNRHHPLWDNDKDTHLFTQQATRAAEELIELIAMFNLDMVLPKGTPTLQHMVTKRYSRPNNVFCTEGILNLLTQCELDPSPCNWSLPYHYQNPLTTGTCQCSFNFREANWDTFWRTLCTKLNLLPNLTSLNNKDQLNTATNN